MSEETDMPDNDDWQAAQHADDLQLQRAAIEALKEAHRLGLGESECMAIAHSAGLANTFYKEIRK